MTNPGSMVASREPASGIPGAAHAIGSRHLCASLLCSPRWSSTCYGPGQAAPGPYPGPAGLLLAGWAAHPRGHRLLLGSYPAVTLFVMLFTEVLRCRVWKVTIQFTKRSSLSVREKMMRRIATSIAVVT